MTVIHIAVCPVACQEAYSRYTDNPIKVEVSWEDCTNLDKLEVIERVRVVQIYKFFEGSQHVLELVIIY